jgi:hypothetical protein
MRPGLVHVGTPLLHELHAAILSPDTKLQSTDNL